MPIMPIMPTMPSQSHERCERELGCIGYTASYRVSPEGMVQSSGMRSLRPLKPTTERCSCCDCSGSTTSLSRVASVSIATSPEPLPSTMPMILGRPSDVTYKPTPKPAVLFHTHSNSCIDLAGARLPEDQEHPDRRQCRGSLPRRLVRRTPRHTAAETPQPASRRAAASLSQGTTAPAPFTIRGERRRAKTVTSEEGRVRWSEMVLI